MFVLVIEIDFQKFFKNTLFSIGQFLFKNIIIKNKINVQC